MKHAQVKIGMLVRVAITPKREAVGLVVRHSSQLDGAVLIVNDRYPEGFWVRARDCRPAKRQPSVQRAARTEGGA